jgi:predicted MFS family arabinose efflux permease
VFAAVQGIGALVGGAVAGALVDHHVRLLAVVIGVLQVVAAVLLWRTTRRR